MRADDKQAVRGPASRSRDDVDSETSKSPASVDLKGGWRCNLWDWEGTTGGGVDTRVGWGGGRQEQTVLDCTVNCILYCTVRVVDVEREDLIKVDVGCIHSTMTVSTRCIKYRYISLNISTSGKETAHTKLGTQY